MSAENKAGEGKKGKAGQGAMSCCTPETVSEMMSRCCGSGAKGETPDISEIMVKCCEGVSEGADCCPTAGKEE